MADDDSNPGARTLTATRPGLSERENGIGRFHDDRDHTTRAGVQGEDLSVARARDVRHDASSTEAPLIVKPALIVVLASVMSAAGACSHERTPPPSSAPPTASSAAPGVAAVQGTTPAAEHATIGAPAPDFTLPDLDGHDVHLASFRGRTVVLEWFNPQCPFVNKSHTKGSLKTAASRHTAEGVTWLAIDSAAPGKQGYEVETIRAAVARFGLSHPVLRDANGAVGHAYGATNTPHMFVIDKNGVLVYGGAIDNSPDAEGESPQGGVLVNYVDAALEDLSAGRPVRTPSTKAYGCGVKYSS
jgi:peroxiredoxin